MSSIEIRPLQRALPFGVRVAGVTREALTLDDVRAQLSNAFEAHGMIVFEDIEQSNEMQVAVSNVFGPLKEHPVAAVARVEGDGMLGVVEIRSPANSGGVVDLAGVRLSHWLPWHFDHCYNDELNRAGVLRAVQIVEVGGITGFADGVALYNAFPKDLLARIEAKEILYRLDGQYETMRFGRPHQFEVIRPKPEPPGFRETAMKMPRAIHPAVWTRKSGEKVLHVSPYMAQGIVDDEGAHGDALLEEVCQSINRLATSCSYQHKWSPSDMVIWDNWRLLHCVSGNRPEDERVMYRTTIKGDYGHGRFENNGVGGKILETTV
jgi:taurine dioxygenase